MASGKWRPSCPGCNVLSELDISQLCIIMYVSRHLNGHWDLNKNQFQTGYTFGSADFIVDNSSLGQTMHWYRDARSAPLLGQI